MVSKSQRATQEAKPMSGFTLIELLVVVSIIALLVAILLPALGKARISARQVVCASNLKGIGTGMMMYLDSYGDVFPPASDPARPADYIPYWWQYVVHQEIIQTNFQDWYDSIDDPTSATIWRCPEKKPSVQGARIGFNEHLNVFVSGRPIQGRKANTISHPVEMIVMGDSERDLFSYADWAPPSDVILTRTPEMGLCTYSFAFSRHGGGKDAHSKQANMFFADGHLQSMATIEYSDPDNVPRTRAMWIPDEQK